jgi:uncharacterized protein (TIGR03067 family)
MNTLLRLALVVAVGPLLSSSCGAQETDPITLAPSTAADSALLQGKWEGVEVGREGSGTCTLTVSGDTMHFQGSNKDEWYKATFNLPTGTNPKQLKGTIIDCPRPEMVGKTSTGLFKIEEGKLTLAGCKPGTGEAPKSFDADASVRVFIFKKAPVAK